MIIKLFNYPKSQLLGWIDYIITIIPPIKKDLDHMNIFSKKTYFTWYVERLIYSPRAKAYSEAK